MISNKVFCDYDYRHNFYDVGTTIVQCIAGNNAVDEQTCSFQITVVDNIKPIIICPSDFVINERRNCQHNVNWNFARLDDNCGSDFVSVSCTSNQGDNFLVGTTTVVCTATDQSNNSQDCSFDVTVVDNTNFDCPASDPVNDDGINDDGINDDGINDDGVNDDGENDDGETIDYLSPGQFTATASPRPSP